MSCTVHTHLHVRGHPPILLHTVAGSCPDIRRASEKEKEGVGGWKEWVSEQSWVVVVVEGVGGGGCDELHSKLSVHCEQQD